jgi:hypothetical protein
MTVSRVSLCLRVTIRGTDVGPAFTVRWNGRKWVRVPIPDAGMSVLSGVAAISARNAWAVGGGADHAVMEHWDGANWTAVPTRHPPRPDPHPALHLA